MVIALAGLAAYANSFQGTFVFDDEPAIARNSNLETLWPLTKAMTAPPDTTLSGRPVATFTFALDHALFAGSLEGYHATNLAIHIGVSVLLFLLVRLTLNTDRLSPRFGDSGPALALSIALIFVVHPLQTGAVTYIVQRVESLMALFYLATVYAAARALSEDPSARRGWSTLAVIACGLGMATKEVMVTAPLMVILWDRLFAFEKSRGRPPLYLGLVSTWGVLGILVASSPRGASAGFGFEEWPWWRYLLTQAEVLPHYLRLAFLPSPLVLDYQWPAAQSWTEVAAPGLLVMVLLLATLWGLVRATPAAFIGAWFFLILAPTSSVLPIVTEVAAEHRMYLPLAGVITLVVIGCFLGLGRLVETLNLKASLVWMVARVAVVGLVLLLGSMTYDRNADYGDFDRMWTDTIAKRPNNARARNNLATSFLAQGRFAEAESHLRVAIENNRNFAEAEANLGVALSALGRLEEGAGHLSRAVELRPGFAEAHRNLGENFAMRHKMKDAVTAYEAALLRLPDDVRLLNRIGWILATTGDEGLRDDARARDLAERAVRLTGAQDAPSLDTLGAALAGLGEFDRALDALNAARTIAKANRDPELLRDLEFRLELYSKRQPFREP